MGGKLRLWFRIGGTQVSREALVANIFDWFILGLDFLMAHGYTVDAEAGSLRIGAEEVPLHNPLPSEQARCYRVTADEDTLILPHSEAIVLAKIIDNALCEPCGTIGPSMTAMLPPDVMVGKTLIDVQNDYVPVKLVNLAVEPRKVCSGTEVASCEPVESVLHQQFVFGPESKETGGDLPDHLKDIYTRSDGQQCQLLELLCEFQEIFSRGPQDLGRTGLAKHEIDTGAAATVRQPPRKLPLAQREEARKAVEEMHQQGIIEPSNSQWS